MVGISLNGKPVEVEGQPPSLLELVAAVEREHVQDDRIIVEVKVDGKKLEGFTLADGSLVPYDETQTVEIICLKTSEIQAGILGRFITYLERVVPHLESLVGLFRSGETEEAYRHYRDAIESIQSLFELIQNIQASQQIKIDAAVAGGLSLSDLAGRLKGTLEELISAQTAGDSERMADALEFELIDQLKTWLGILPELRRRIEGGEESDPTP